MHKDQATQPCTYEYKCANILKQRPRHERRGITNGHVHENKDMAKVYRISIIRQTILRAFIREQKSFSESGVSSFETRVLASCNHFSQIVLHIRRRAYSSIHDNSIILFKKRIESKLCDNYLTSPEYAHRRHINPMTYTFIAILNRA